ncbi:hypothetical protein [Agreia sp. Leaf283]|uniref:hypothetical protein n=1 Tax=Agreia sp. Leaf283 TaxID=1736321 RepID=UPI0012FC169C|nr:hypothetical protein [Agreia sp. Leaf283]
MKKTPIERSFSFDSSLPAVDAARRIKSYFAQIAKSVPDDAGLTGEVRIGSRFAYRVWGATAIGVRRVPAEVTWAIEPASDGSVLSIRMESDEGKYAFRTSYHVLAYEQRFDELSEKIREQLA